MQPYVQMEGFTEGLAVGTTEGFTVGLQVGFAAGGSDGASVGAAVGMSDNAVVGKNDDNTILEKQENKENQESIHPHLARKSLPRNRPRWFPYCLIRTHCTSWKRC